jgi:hypothetical protein
MTTLLKRVSAELSKTLMIVTTLPSPLDRGSVYRGRVTVDINRYSLVETALRIAVHILQSVHREVLFINRLHHCIHLSPIQTDEAIGFDYVLYDTVACDVALLMERRANEYMMRVLCDVMAHFNERHLIFSLPVADTDLLPVLKEQWHERHFTAEMLEMSASATVAATHLYVKLTW